MKIFASLVALAAMYQSVPASTEIEAENPTAEAETPVENDLTPYLRDWLKNNAKDPESIRLELTTPARHMDVVLKRGLLGKKEWTGWIACYRMNAKNSYGAYTGYKPVVVLLTDESRLVMWIEDHQYSYARKMVENYC